MHMALYPLHIAFSSYTVIGLTLLVLAGSIAIYLLRLGAKTQATWSLIGFFSMVALSGTATILANGVSYWDRLFLPWQDFWILASGVFLVQFAYSFPRIERPLEFTIVRVAIGSLVLFALAYCIFFDYRFLFHWTPGLTVDEPYYLLLPIGVLLIVFIFLRRSVYLSNQASSSESHAGQHNGWRNLIQPQDDHARVLRNLALALSLAFLPALQIFLRLPYPSGFILSNIGSILAIIAIALIYFNFAPEVNSFMGKLVGITLTTVLLILAIYGAMDIYLNQEEYYADHQQSIVTVHHTLITTGELTAAPDLVAYVVSWDASRPKDIDTYHQLYPTDGESNFDLAVLANENRAGYLDNWSTPVTGQLAQSTHDEWRTVRRYWTYPTGSSQPDFQGYIFRAGNVAYEIGLSKIAESDRISNIVSRWLALILVSSAFVLLVFPLFFRRILVEPLGNLLAGIHRVNQGELDMVIPVRFNDEIGFLTRSFNQMADSLNQATQDIQNRAFLLETEINRRTRNLTETTVRLEEEIQDRENAESRLNQQLIYQKALANCSKSLLVVTEEESGQQQVLNQALEPLRFAVQASRAYIFRAFDDADLGPCIGMLAEVCAPGIPAHIDNPVNQKFPLSRLPKDFLRELQEGNPYGGLVAEVFASDPTMQEALLTQSPPLLSLMLFPLFYGDRFWGFLGFDDCTTEREWDVQVISLLRTASEMIGNTLQRWQVEAQLHETLDHLEDRVRERTVKYAKLNAELRHEIYERQRFQEELESRFEIERILANISTRLLEPTRIRENITISLKDLGRIMDAERIFLIEFDPQGKNQVKNYFEWHRPEVSPVPDDDVQSVIGALIGLEEQLRKGETIYIADTAKFSSYPEINMQPLRAQAIKSLVLSPLTIDHSIQSVLGCSNLQAAPGIIKTNIRALELVASMLKSLLQREHLIHSLEEQVAERTRQLTTFLDMAMLTDRSQDLVDILQSSLLSVIQITGSDAAGIHIINEKKSSLELIAQRGIPHEFVEAMHELKINAEFGAWLKNVDEYQVFGDQYNSPSIPEPFRFPGYQVYFANLLRSGTEYLGMLSCYRIEEQPFSSFQLTLLSALSELLGIIVENYRLKIEAQELAAVEERQRLAREIHDAISQSVYSLSLFARSANDSLQARNEEKVLSNLQDIESIALQAMREMRLLLYQLRETGQDDDLATALEARFKQVENRLGIQATHEIERDLILPTNIQHQVWRILIEALNNIVKHANASHVFVQINCLGEYLYVSIQDDGIGFDLKDYSPGMGLKNIQVRVEKVGGQLDILSELSQGTEIRLKIPLDCLDIEEGD